jgi:hypothetical protein
VDLKEILHPCLLDLFLATFGPLISSRVGWREGRARVAMGASMKFWSFSQISRKPSSLSCIRNGSIDRLKWRMRI